MIEMIDADNVDACRRLEKRATCVYSSKYAGLSGKKARDGSGHESTGRFDFMLINHSDGFYDGKQFARPVIGRVDDAPPSWRWRAVTCLARGHIGLATIITFACSIIGSVRLPSVLSSSLRAGFVRSSFVSFDISIFINYLTGIAKVTFIRVRLNNWIHSCRASSRRDPSYVKLKKRKRRKGERKIFADDAYIHDWEQTFFHSNIRR